MQTDLAQKERLGFSPERHPLVPPRKETLGTSQSRHSLNLADRPSTERKTWVQSRKTSIGPSLDRHLQKRNSEHQLKQTLIETLKQTLTERNTGFSSDIHYLVIPDRHLKRNFGPIQAHII